VALHHGRLTYRNISETKCFTVNAMPASLAAETDYCGLRSGRDEDKAATAGLALSPADHIAAPVVDQSPLNLECRLSGEMEIGEYRLLLGEILEVHAAEAAYGAAGEVDPKVFDPLVYLGGIRQYWSLGEKVEDAYKAGTKLFATK
jgi:flavin reductase (DIM6/NTAB) family NADH-FMN oxidoreductase RutF